MSNNVENKKFGYLFSILFLISTYIFAFKILFLFLFIITLLITFFKPNLLNYLRKKWLIIGFLISKVTKPIILAFIFYVIISPISIFFRIKKRDLLNINNKKTTLWITTEKMKISDDFFFKQY